MTFFANTATTPAVTPLFINSPRLYDPRAHGYSHVAVARTPARLIYVAGQGGETWDGALSADFDVQVQQALHNLRTALVSAGAELTDVVKLVLLVVDHSEARLAVLARALRAVWDDGLAPACTLIPVPRLALDGMLFEIEATAVAPLVRGVSA